MHIKILHTQVSRSKRVNSILDIIGVNSSLWLGGINITFSFNMYPNAKVLIGYEMINQNESFNIVYHMT